MKLSANVTSDLVNEILFKMPLRTFEVITLLLLGFAILLLLVNIYLTKHYYMKLIHDSYDFKFERQILQPPLRHSTTNDFTSYYDENNHKQSEEIIFRDNQPKSDAAFATPASALHAEQEQFDSFPVYYLDAQQESQSRNVPPQQRESPLKPLADLMNNRTREYRERMSRLNGSGKQVGFREYNNVAGVEQAEQYEFESQQIVNEVNTRVIDEHSNKFTFRKEKSVENLTIVSEMKRSKSWDSSKIKK